MRAPETRKAAHPNCGVALEKPEPARIVAPCATRRQERQRRTPFPSPSLRDREALRVLSLGNGPVALLSDARRRRAEAMLRDEEPVDEAAEIRAWNDRPRGAA